MAKYTVEIPDDKARKLRVKSAETGVPIKKLLSQYVEFGIEQSELIQSKKGGKK